MTSAAPPAADRSAADEPVARRVRIVAHYLPQFHPVPENDEFWGPGFSEWTTVAGARPLFRGHRQPALPGELGFYDLRLAESREHQAEMARTYGVEAFLYWHYWFGGRRVLERPFLEVLEEGSPQFPFCVAWANHSWTRVWGGRSGDVLLEQQYPGPDDHRRHFDALEPAFHDPRYFEVGGKPLFFLFHPEAIPDLAASLDVWRERAQASGLPGLHVVGRVEGFWSRTAALDVGRHLDGVVDYSLGYVFPKTRRAVARRLSRRPQIAPFARAVDTIPRLLDGLHSYPTVLPGWDASPRHGRRAAVLVDRRPELFEAMVDKAIALVVDRPADDRLVFLKSWNEWSEGNYIEPDREWGRAFLEALDRATRQGSGPP